MISIQHTEDLNYNGYRFKANNTRYDIIISKGDHSITVYSNRIGLSRHDTVIKCYDTLEQLKDRSKAFNNFVLLIQE